ncbi:nucleotidyltransferase-like protein [Sutcliffiella cohnii]
MEDLLRPIYQERASQSNTLGTLLIEKRNRNSPNTDRFDAILLMIVKELETALYIKHYDIGEQKAALYVVSEGQLKDWIQLGTNRRVIDWIMNGKILFDRNEYIITLRNKLDDYPLEDRKVKIGIEFAKLIRRYMEGKDFFESNHHLDAFNHIVHSLHHLARLSVIENGFHPELTVWNQVKQIEPQIHKLYEELVEGEEPIEKRLELLFLASEFLIHSRTKIGIQHLLDVLNTKETSWSYNDLLNEPELAGYIADLTVLIDYLVEKGLIEAVKVETKGHGVYHRMYKVSNE